MEENPRKKLKLGPEGTNRLEDQTDNEEETSREKKDGKRNSKFCLDISLEEDEKLLDDSGIDLHFCKEEGFEIRRISLTEREGSSRSEKTDNDSGKHSYCRGEMPETNETDKHGEEGVRPEGKNDTPVKKTPDKSLFRKVQEKLMYECSLTPKKVKKKCLELKMDF